MEVGSEIDPPAVNEHQWIKICNQGIDGCVLGIFGPGHLSVGYHQNQLKAVREEVLWSGDNWVFKYSGINGTNLKEPLASMVKRGPYRG